MFFRRINLATKLVFMMLLLTLLSLGASYVYNVRSEQEFIKRFEDNIGDLSHAIQISVEELTSTERTNEARLADYVKRLKSKGVKELSIVSAEQEVIASSNPDRVGAKIEPRVDPKHKDLFITAQLGDEQDERSPHREYNLLVPIVVGAKPLGFVHIKMFLEDYGQFLQDNHRRRLVTTVIIFFSGIVFSIFLSIKYTRPIDAVVKSAKKVASGDLSQTLPVHRNDEIGELTRSFNEMVEKLRYQKGLEERLRHAEQLSVLGHMASGIAHEIRNPLNLINLSIDYLQSQFSKWDAVRQKESEQVILNIKAEIYRLNHMIENFLKYGKPLILHFAETDIVDLLSDVVALACHKAGDQGVEIAIHPDANLPKISADFEQLKTCFINIILNAIQSMPYGGKLEIRVRHDFYSPSEGEWLKASLYVTFQDSGCGISEEDLKKIFEPYFTTKKLGIGLGLALTKKIVEEHGGAIDVRSQVGQGAQFTLQLPVLRVDR